MDLFNTKSSASHLRLYAIYRGKQMTDTWERALDAYAYPVNLEDYELAGDFPLGWFEDTLSKGDRSETIAFEDRFRREAQTHIEAWYEVIFWKLYSFGMSRDNLTSQVLNRVFYSGVPEIIRTMRARKASPEQIKDIAEIFDYDEENAEKTIEITGELLWDKCWHYIENPSLESFQGFRDILFKTNAVATAATFPAFLKPEDFPMVDRQVARWARRNGLEHSFESCGGPSLITYPRLGEKPLTDRDWGFVQSWIEWCRFAAGRLNDLTERNWRARDVEMAVFTAQRKSMPLEPLTM